MIFFKKKNDVLFPKQNTIIIIFQILVSPKCFGKIDLFVFLFYSVFFSIVFGLFCNAGLKNKISFYFGFYNYNYDKNCEYFSTIITTNIIIITIVTIISGLCVFGLCGLGVVWCVCGLCVVWCVWCVVWWWCGVCALVCKLSKNF